MKTLIATLIVVIGLLGCGNLGLNKQAQVEQLAWLATCQLLLDEAVGYECHRLMPPIVGYEEMDEDYLGRYSGGDTIWINSDLTRTELFSTLMHEMIHYIHVHQGILEVPGPALEVCWSENEAWVLTGIYYNEDNSLWWQMYPHCWQYYGDSRYLRDVGYIYNEINDIVDGIIFED